MNDLQNKKQSKSKPNQIKNIALGDVMCISLSDILEYEIRSGYFAQFVWFEWGQELIGSYFAWKTTRKYSRYMKSLEMQGRLKRCI